MTDVRNPPMMRCGHAANARHVRENGGSEPCSAICNCVQIDTTPPDLTGRTATCSCGKIQPSSVELAFFSYRGPGAAHLPCEQCPYVETVHQAINPATGREGVTDHEYIPRVYEHDSYYCGCRGWD